MRWDERSGRMPSDTVTKAECECWYPGDNRDHSQSSTDGVVIGFVGCVEHLACVITVDAMNNAGVVVCEVRFYNAVPK